MQIGVIGVNHTLADLKIREQLAQICVKRFGPNSIHADGSYITLSTCNRTEIYFSSEVLSETHSYIITELKDYIDDPFDQRLYSFFGYECFLHLARVTCGLDSAIVAETEIQGQVKAAYEKTLSCTSLPSPLHYLFQKSLKMGKRVRTDLPLKRGVPDLEHAILAIGNQCFEDLSLIKVLFIGASAINLKILHFLKNKKMDQIAICNRTHHQYDQLSAKVIPWENRELWYDFDWLVFGTSAPYHLIQTENYFPRKSQLILDLSVPRNVDPHLSQLNQLTIYNIDQLNESLQIRREKLFNTLSQAENLVNQSIKKYISIYHAKQEYRPKEVQEFVCTSL